LRKHLPDRVFESVYFGGIHRMMARSRTAEPRLPQRQEK
jgi:hypothetical protein